MLVNALLGGDNSNFINSILNTLQVLVLFVVLLLYHLSALRKDGVARADRRRRHRGVLDHDRDHGGRPLSRRPRKGHGDRARPAGRGRPPDRKSVV